MAEIDYKKGESKGHSYKILLENAKAWESLYKKNIKNNESLSNKNVCIICLLFALELYLKSYLIFLNAKYKKDKKLKKLGHNFKFIFEKINKNSQNKTTTNEIRKKLDEYNLRRENFNFVELRYPQLDSESIYPYLSYELGENIFDNIFRRIEYEINNS